MTQINRTRNEQETLPQTPEKFRMLQKKKNTSKKKSVLQKKICTPIGLESVKEMDKFPSYQA